MRTQKNADQSAMRYMMPTKLWEEGSVFLGEQVLSESINKINRKTDHDRVRDTLWFYKLSGTCDYDETH